MSTTTTTEPAESGNPFAIDQSVPCTPSGSVITDAHTGDTYVYGAPTYVGYDTCGNPIPDICVAWPDGSYSHLWSIMGCEPLTAATTAPAAAWDPVEELPETGTGLGLAVIAVMLVAAGAGLAWLARRERKPEPKRG